MTLGLDLKGGSRITLQADLQGQTDVDLDESMGTAKDIIENRVNPFGVSEAQVQRAGDDRLIVELPGVSAETARDITRPAVLMFCEPLQEGGKPGDIQGDATANVATSAQAAEVYYKPGTCEPDVDENGAVALAAPDNPDGTPGRNAPRRVGRSSAHHAAIRPIGGRASFSDDLDACARRAWWSADCDDGRLPEVKRQRTVR